MMNVTPKDVSAPRSAWILTGGKETFENLLHPQPTEPAEVQSLEELWGASTVVIDGNSSAPVEVPLPALPPIPETSGSWTASPNVEPGDKLFLYFKSPLRAVHFVATAETYPYTAPAYNNAKRDQWWVDYSDRVQIRPISKQQIEKVFDERKLLLNASFRYIRPDFANRLLEHVQILDDPTEQSRYLTMQPVAGKEELGNPETIGVEELRTIVSADFTYEEDVERNFLEPLLRLSRVADSARVQRRHFVNDREIVDYAVFREDRPCCVIEVKREIRWPKQNWQKLKELKQARNYAGLMKTPFVLIDSDRVACFAADDVEPRLSIHRHQLSESDLRLLREHILGLSLT